MASKIRGRIIEAALRKFAEKGFHGCSTRDIAAIANVTEGSVFRLCESKEVLFADTVREAVARLIPIKAFRLRLSTHRDFTEALMFAVGGIRDSLTRDVTRVLLFSMMDGSPDLETQALRHFNLYRSAIARRMRKAVKEKQLSGGFDARADAGRLILDLILSRAGYASSVNSERWAAANGAFNLVAVRWLEGLSQREPRNRSKHS